MHSQPSLEALTDRLLEYPVAISSSVQHGKDAYDCAETNTIDPKHH